MVAAAITKKETNVLVYEYCIEKELSKVSDNIIKNSPKNTQNPKIHLKNISDEVREYKDLAINQISRLFGNIHFL